MNSAAGFGQIGSSCLTITVSFSDEGIMITASFCGKFGQDQTSDKAVTTLATIQDLVIVDIGESRKDAASKPL